MTPPHVHGQGREALPVFFGVMSYGPMTRASRGPRGKTALYDGENAGGREAERGRPAHLL